MHSYPRYMYVDSKQNIKRATAKFFAAKTVPELGNYNLKLLESAYLYKV